ncbi:radical SAM protein [Candidatus Harpocratesius sp.]
MTIEHFIPIYKKSSHYSELNCNAQKSINIRKNESYYLNICDYWDDLDLISHEVIQSKKNNSVPPLRRLGIFITELCNLNCQHCNLLSNKKTTVDMDELIHVIKQAKNLGALFFDIMGLGEPTLVPNLPDIMNIAKDLGYIITLGTNGATLNLSNPEYVNRLLNATPLKLRISLDSSNAQKHDEIRGKKGVWESAVNFIKKAVYERENNQKKIAIFINRIVTNENINDIPNDLEFFGELKVDDVHLIPIRNKYNSSYFCSRSQIKHYQEKIIPKIKILSKKYKMSWLGKNAYIFGKNDDDFLLSERGLYYPKISFKDCYIMKSQIIFDQNFNIYSCLWAKRARGKPILSYNVNKKRKFKENPHLLEELRALIIRKNLLNENSEICMNSCARNIIIQNNRIQESLNNSNKILH